MEMRNIMEILVDMKATADADREERNAHQARIETKINVNQAKVAKQ
jgi:hypothetical protein